MTFSPLAGPPKFYKKASPETMKKNRDIEAKEKFQPVIAKINMVLAMAEAKQDKAVPFVQNVLEYVKNNYHISTKQMTALNKVHKRVSENLFEEKA